jgi:hypothetical protein
MVSTKTRGRRIEGKGPFIYKDYRDNHVIWPVNSFSNPSRA